MNRQYLKGVRTPLKAATPPENPEPGLKLKLSKIPTPGWLKARQAPDTRKQPSNFDLEFGRIPQARWLRQADPELHRALSRLPWIEDGLNPAEAKAVAVLNAVHLEADRSIARSIARMPFFTRLEPGGLEALTSLHYLLTKDRAAADRILKHPRMARGITAADAPLVAGIHPAAKNAPRIADKLLAMTPEDVPERTITLNGRPVRLAVISPENGCEDVLPALEQEMRDAQSFMHAPLPATAVFALLAEAAPPGASAFNCGSCIVVSPETAGPDKPRWFNHALAHEILHFWWLGNAPWLDEGLCNVIAETTASSRIGQQPHPTVYQAWPEHSAESLDRARQPNYGDSYAIGERFFLDLLNRAGRVRFQEAANRLYGIGQAEGKPLGIQQTLEAFHEQREAAELAYRKGGQPAPPPARGWDPAGAGLKAKNLQLTEGQPGKAMKSPPKAGEKPRTPTLIRFSCRLKTDTQSATSKFTVTHYGPDGFAYQRFPVTMTGPPPDAEAEWLLSVGPEPGRPWAPGIHQTVISTEEGKTAAEIRLVIDEPG